MPFSARGRSAALALHRELRANRAHHLPRNDGEVAGRSGRAVDALEEEARITAAKQIEARIHLATRVAVLV